MLQHCNGYLPEDTDELLDEVTALVDKMDSSIPSHPSPFPSFYSSNNLNGLETEGPLRLNGSASSDYFKNRGRKI